MNYIEIQRMRKQAQDTTYAQPRPGDAYLSDKENIKARQPGGISYKYDLRGGKVVNPQILPDDKRVLSYQPNTKMTSENLWNAAAELPVLAPLAGISLPIAGMATGSLPAAMAGAGAAGLITAATPGAAIWSGRAAHNLGKLEKANQNAIKTQQDTLSYHDFVYKPWQKKFYESRGYKQVPTGKVHPDTGEMVYNWVPGK